MSLGWSYETTHARYDLSFSFSKHGQHTRGLLLMHDSSPKSSDARRGLWAHPFWGLGNGLYRRSSRGGTTSHRATKTNLLLHIRSTDDVGRVPITGHIMHSDGSGTALLTICSYMIQSRKKPTHQISVHAAAQLWRDEDQTAHA